MFGLTMERIERIVKGRLSGGQGIMPSGAALDTRNIQAGELFFALKGENSDGHDYLQAARDKKAAGAVVSRCPNAFRDDSFPLLYVEEVEKALRDLAAAMRKASGVKIAAVTGSVGKTSTKDMLRSILSRKGPALANKGNYNNELGLPLTLLALQEEHEYAVLEMGMRGLGEIDYLSRIAKPDYGVITNIGYTHLELLGSRERIAQAKAELFRHIPPQGGIALCAKDRDILKPWLSDLKCTPCWVGLDSSCDVWAEDILEYWQEDEGKGGIAFKIYYRGKQVCNVELPVLGRHNVINALLAAALAVQMGLSWQDVACGLKELEMTAMRLDLKRVEGLDVIIIDDAYNANPASVVSALEAMKSLPVSGKEIAVLGDMYELGAYETEGHLQVGKALAKLDVSFLLTVGKLAETIAQGAKIGGMPEERIRAYRSNQEALAGIKEILEPEDVVLVKGSRGMKMEEIVAGISKFSL